MNNIIFGLGLLFLNIISTLYLAWSLQGVWDWILEHEKEGQDNADSTDKLIALVQEIMFTHRDKESCDYNNCEEHPCVWCISAQKAIDGIRKETNKKLRR